MDYLTLAKLKELLEQKEQLSTPAEDDSAKQINNALNTEFAMQDYMVKPRSFDSYPYQKLMPELEPERFNLIKNKLRSIKR